MAFTKTGPEAFANLTDMMLEGFSPTDILSVADTGKLPMPYPAAPEGIPEDDLFTSIVNATGDVEMAAIMAGKAAREGLQSTMIDTIKRQNNAKEQIASRLFAKERADGIRSGDASILKNQDELKGNIAKAMGISPDKIRNRTDQENLTPTAAPVQPLQQPARMIVQGAPVKGNYDNPYQSRDIRQQQVVRPRQQIIPNQAPLPSGVRPVTTNPFTLEELMVEIGLLREQRQNIRENPGSIFPGYYEYTDEDYMADVQDLLSRAEPDVLASAALRQTMGGAGRWEQLPPELMEALDKASTPGARASDSAESLSKLIVLSWGVNPRGQRIPDYDDLPKRGSTKMPNRAWHEAINAEMNRQMEIRAAYNVRRQGGIDVTSADPSGIKGRPTYIPSITNAGELDYDALPDSWKRSSGGFLSPKETKPSQIIGGEPFMGPMTEGQAETAWVGSLAEAKAESDAISQLSRRQGSHAAWLRFKEKYGNDWPELMPANYRDPEGEVAPPVGGPAVFPAPPSQVPQGPVAPPDGEKPFVVDEGKTQHGVTHADLLNPRKYKQIGETPIMTNLGNMEIFSSVESLDVYGRIGNTVYGLGTASGDKEQGYTLRDANQAAGVPFYTLQPIEGFAPIYHQGVKDQSIPDTPVLGGPLVPESPGGIPLREHQVSRSDPLGWWESARLREGVSSDLASFGFTPAYNKFFLNMPYGTGAPQSFAEFMQDPGSQDISRDFEMARMGSAMAGQTPPEFSSDPGWKAWETMLGTDPLTGIEDPGRFTKTMAWANYLGPDQSDSDIKESSLRILHAGLGLGSGEGAARVYAALSALYDKYETNMRLKEAGPGGFVAEIAPLLGLDRPMIGPSG